MFSLTHFGDLFDGKAANAVAFSAHRGVSISFFWRFQKPLLRNEVRF